MSNESPAQTPPPAAPPAGPEPHLFDRLSVLYKYRWASVLVFALVVGWVMVDSYTRIPVFQATGRLLIEEPSADIATPVEIARSVSFVDPEEVLMLPAEIETVTVIRGGGTQRNRITQRFSDYRRFLTGVTVTMFAARYFGRNVIRYDCPFR